jgi:hypothetical protein
LVAVPTVVDFDQTGESVFLYDMTTYLEVNMVENKHSPLKSSEPEDYDG